MFVKNFEICTVVARVTTQNVFEAQRVLIKKLTLRGVILPLPSDPAFGCWSSLNFYNKLQVLLAGKWWHQVLVAT